MRLSTTAAADRAYCAPSCEELALEQQAVVCTSLESGEVTPGFGENWGIF